MPMSSMERHPTSPSTQVGCDCRTPCRSAARAPHERFVDVTPISLRRLRPLQRLVRRQDNQFLQFPRRSRADRPTTLTISRPQPRRPPLLLIASPHRWTDGRWPPQVRRSASPFCTTMTSLRGTFHHHLLTVERLAVQRRAAVCGRPSAATACYAAFARLAPLCSPTRFSSSRTTRRTTVSIFAGPSVAIVRSASLIMLW